MEHTSLNNLIVIVTDTPDVSNLSDHGIRVSTSLPDTPLIPTEVLVVTDSAELLNTLKRDGIPAVGYEHDGIRLSCSEIILSLSVLTADYVTELHMRLTGRAAVYSDPSLTLYPMTEDEYCEVFQLYRAEPYMLTEDTRTLSEEDVRLLYQTRFALSRFAADCGMFRAVDHDGTTVGYGSVFDEVNGASFRTVISYYILPSLRRQGFGRKLALALIGFARSNNPAREIYAKVHPDNKASIRLLTSLGFLLTPSDAPQETRKVRQSLPSGPSRGRNESQVTPLSVYCLPGRP